jgi:transcriptional regulator with XRE-family HTH domain
MKPQPHLFFVMDFGEKVRELRATVGLSQAAFAAKAGVSQSAIAAYEVGRREPTAMMAAALAKALGVAVEELIDKDAIPKAPDELQRDYIHGNSRVAKIQEVFEQLKPQHQRAILQQAEALLETTKDRGKGRPLLHDYRAEKRQKKSA